MISDDESEQDNSINWRRNKVFTADAWSQYELAVADFGVNVKPQSSENANQWSPKLTYKSVKQTNFRL